MALAILPLHVPLLLLGGFAAWLCTLDAKHQHQDGYTTRISHIS